MATVTDSLIWDEATVRQRTRLPDADAAELEELFDAAKEAADAYLNNPFVDDDENDVAVPTRVVRGVYALIQAEYYLDGNAMQVQSEKTHMLSVTYRNSEEALAAIQYRYWAPWRCIPGF